jgi:hypothetical protein
MNLSAKSAIVSGTALLLATALGYAASDFLLEIEGVAGESNTSPSSIELNSFSFGASNPTTVGPGSSASSGRTAASSGVVAPRDAATGQASGKRVSTGDVTGDGRADLLAASAVGQTVSFSATFRESPTKASTGGLARCAQGQHIAKATLRGPRQTVSLDNVVVTSCPGASGERRHEFTGHVTLIK